MTISTFVDDLVDYLHANGFGTPGTDIFTEGLEAAEKGISVTPYQGTNLQWIRSQEENPHNPFLQVLVRNMARDQARSIAYSIYELWRRLPNVRIGTTNFILIEARGTPMPLGLTKNLAFEYSVNFSLILQ